MKNSIKQLVEKNRALEKAEAATARAEIESPLTKDDRRSFLKKSVLGGITLTGLMNLPLEDVIAETTSKVSRRGSPSDLKITDMRYTTITNGNGATNARNVLLRIDTNQGIYGLGEVRDGGDARFALYLKSRILGLNPCNVEKIFKIVKQFGGHGRIAT
jgi:hypothetical protein